MEITFKQFLCFILVLSLGSHSQANAKLPECPVSTVDLGNMGPPPLFADSGALFNHFEQESGVGRFFTIPQTPADVYFKNSEFSIDTIQKFATESDTYWNNPPREMIQYWNGIQFDWESFSRLNQQAAKLWNKMIECNFDRTSEIRKNFFFGEPCTNEAASLELASELSKLNENIYTFLITSPLIDIKAKADTKHKTLNAAIPPLIPHQHPLLQQLLISFSAMVTSLAIGEKEPAATAVGYYDVMVGFFSEPMEVPEHVKKYYTPQPKMEMPTTVKMVVNLTAILASPLSSCDQFGLWPAMNRSFHQMKGYTYNNIYSPIKELDEHTLKRSVELCGTEVNPVRRDGSVYARFFTLHVYNMKRIFAAYFPENFDISDRKKIAKNTKFLLKKSSFLCR